LRRHLGRADSPRRSPEEIQAGLNKIVLLVNAHKDGVRAEQIRTAGHGGHGDARIKAALRKRKLSTERQKQATTYFTR
jgi:hypothetical protein